LFLGLFEVAAAMRVFFLVLGDGGWRTGDGRPASQCLHRTGGRG